jgi:hypothetical protein
MGPPRTLIPRQVVLTLLEAFDLLEMPYMVVGSTASCIHGLYRATADVDFVIGLNWDGVNQLVEVLQPAFYLDAEMAHTAIRYRRAFNVIHLTTAYKVDLFPAQVDDFSQMQFSRRRHDTTRVFGGDPIELSVCSAEDVILSKLRWYDLGGRTSSQQWNDILGVVAVQGDRLDLPYLRHWAAHLNLSDLLEAALTERHGD